jgi:hypothetical protein
MSERGSRWSGWPAFAVLGVLAVVVIAVLVLTAPPPPPGADLARRWSGGPRSPADSAAYLDSLFDAAERRTIEATMTLAEVAARADIPVDSLAAQLHLPATVSLTSPLRAILIQHGLTLQDVREARRRVELQLGLTAGRR